ncbi:MAG: thioredoxin [Tannerellaceae bacterium]|nr:thioredoxin [Tannerellaceae bacterium]
MEAFNQLTNSDKPVLVSFHTNWCSPCKMMEPIVDQLGTEQHDNARVLKIDIDEHRTLTQQYEIKSIPTFILFKNGEILWRRSEVVDKATLIQEIQKSVD